VYVRIKEERYGDEQIKLKEKINIKINTQIKKKK
jgi:hypothetical protein